MLARIQRYDLVSYENAVLAGRWTPLTDRPMIRASSGWVAIGNSGRPVANESFIGTPLAIGGHELERGIGSFAPGEVVYELDSSSVLLRATVGINREAPVGTGSAVFRVFQDDTQLYESPRLRSGDPPLEIAVPVRGPARLRLVTTSDSPSQWNLATWGDAALLDSAVTLGPSTELRAAAIAARARLGTSFERQQARATLAQEARRRSERVVALTALGPDAGALTVFDEVRGEWLIANREVAVALGYGGVNNGRLSLLRMRQPSLLIDGADSSVVIDGRELRLREGTPGSDGARTSRVHVDAFGDGTMLELPFQFADGTRLLTTLTVLDGSGGLLYQIERPDATITGPSEFRFLEGTSTLLLGDGAEYVTDASRIRHGVVRGDGIERREPMDFGKPLLFWGGTLGPGLLLATVDETDRMGAMSLRLQPGKIRADLSYTSKRSRGMGAAPRLYIEATQTLEPGPAFLNYREAMTSLYPAMPSPSWARYQWGSWYVYFMGVTQREIRAHVNYIADHFADLGPWHILLDAGSYVAEGKPNADFRTVDQEKFPGGIRRIVDYAHSRGVRMVGYLSVPYLDSRGETHHWLGLRGVIDSLGDCLVTIGADDTRGSYAFDFHRPCSRAYWRSVLRTYLVDYDLDGLKVDGLGYAEGALVDPSRLDSFGQVDQVIYQTVDINRFMAQAARQYRPDAYLETGWHVPMMANPYAANFRQDDDSQRLSNPYPFSGIIEHLDYAAFQRAALGQPPHLGTPHGDLHDPHVAELTYRWLEAALASGGYISLSSYLPELPAEVLSELRARLVHYRPFEGTTTVDHPFRPTAIATRRGNLTFVAMINRGPGQQRIDLHLDRVGLRSGRAHTVYQPRTASARTVQTELAEDVPAETLLFSVVPDGPGVVWTNSSFEEHWAGESLTVQLNGPRDLDGFAVVYLPGLQHVTLDGREIRPALHLPLGIAIGGDYEYDAATGLARVRYQHDGPHTLVLRA